MSEYKLITFDMDGTLLNSAKKISPATLEAIKAADTAGKTVALATGRSLPELSEYLDEIPEIRYAVCASGGVLYDNTAKRVLFSSPLAETTVMQLLEYSKKVDVAVHILTGDAAVMEEDKVERLEKYNMGVYKPMFQALAVKPRDIMEYYLAGRPAVAKLNYYTTGPEARELIAAKTKNINAQCFYAETASIEFTAPGVTKGSGIRKLSGFLGIDEGEIIAAGDSFNDVDALRAAGLGAAMENACDELKELADIIIPDNDSDGCAWLIYNYLLK